MPTLKRRYTTNDGKDNWIVSATYDDKAPAATHWFEAQMTATNERTGEKFPFPPEIRTFRLGEIEHTVQQAVALDFGGDRAAAIDHYLSTVLRRVYSYIERGH